MSAYVIVDIDIHDPFTYEEYKAAAAESVALYGGRYVVRGGKTENLEGTWRPSRVVILEFDSVEQARKWWLSPEYAPAKILRHRAAHTRMIIVSGA